MIILSSSLLLIDDDNKDHHHCYYWCELQTRIINLGRVESIIFANKYRSQKGDAMAGRHKGERIVYGSLESVLGKRTKDDLNMAGNATISDALQNGIAKAKASGHVNVGSGVERETLELDDRTLQRQVEHAEVLNRIHLRNVANNIAVPTDDVIVKQRLRELGEPICYFGEDKGDRRDRLKT